MGSNDGIKDWLNSELDHSNNANRRLDPSSDKVVVSLKKGYNALVVKVTQSGGE